MKRILFDQNDLRHSDQDLCFIAMFCRKPLHTFRHIALVTAALLGLTGPALAGETGKAVFTKISMWAQSNSKAPAAGQYANPILRGFYPDPSITRVGDDYYLINSTFAFYPGIPVFHSKDLVHWTQIGNAIDRPSMLDFSGLATSRGVFAPDISYHDGTFYIVNTCVDCKGNFVITAKDPKGPWSDPVWLPFGGIDPSLFWDDDGRAYIVYNDAPEGEPLYSGHRALWMQAFDPKTNAMTGPRKVVVNGGADIAKKPVWIEGPHIYKKDGHYYLMAAEGGTEDGHSEVIFRSDSVWGPYVPYGGNPILTQRDLDRNRAEPIDSSGHADLVETPDGQWWSVFLATRPYAREPGLQGLFNTGRETFMLPVTWKDGWPVILPHGKAIPRQVRVPALPADVQPALDPSANPLAFVGIRTPVAEFARNPEPMKWVLTPRPDAIGDVKSHPAFIGLRQPEARVAFGTKLTYRPQAEGDRAGLAAVQSDDNYLFFGIARRDGKDVLEVTRRAGPNDPRDGVVLASKPIDPEDGEIMLSLVIDGGKASFGYGDAFEYLIQNVDVTNLSSAKAGGFVGTVVGVYAYGQKP